MGIRQDAINRKGELRTIGTTVLGLVSPFQFGDHDSVRGDHTSSRLHSLSLLPATVFGAL